MENTVAMYEDVEEEDVETLSGNYMPSDHEGVASGQTPSALWCTHGPSLPRGLPEDLKFSKHKLISKTPLNKKEEGLTQTINKKYLNKIFKLVFPFYLSSIQACLSTLHLSGFSPSDPREERVHFSSRFARGACYSSSRAPGSPL